MRFEFWSVGRGHELYVKAGVEDFTSRITNYFPLEWRILDSKKTGSNISPEKIKEQESAVILSSLKPEDYLVALDERGKSLTSPKLADFIADRANERVKRLIFLIGGAYGLDEKVLSRAKFSWSLSSLTFPHQLVRLILAEQVYRACTIMRNEKYHHG
ncbi:MAG TPA: 23S rRNA (pseudouridine(1915)-N(3))-methyltransferase RlmH [Puia sp.]|nr:23S rRNA (pseudouridine(1915)-N(3))-methyltransferase RlmH [Puia sp.]